MIKWALSSLLVFSISAPCFSEPPKKEICPAAFLKEDFLSLHIAALQSGHLKHVKLGKRGFVPHETPAVTQGMRMILNTLEKQDSSGGVDLKGKGISVYENALLLSYLNMVKTVLNQQLEYQKELTDKQVLEIREGIVLTNQLIHGSSENPGLLTFFRTTAFNRDRGMFQEGPNHSSKMKANIVALTVLGQPFLDNAFGLGTTWQVWQNIKHLGGLDNPVRICDSEVSNKFNGVAVNLLRCLIAQYTKVAEEGATEGERTKARECAYFLKIDHDALLSAVVDETTPEGPQKLWVHLLAHDFNPYQLGGEYHFGFNGAVPESN